MKGHEELNLARNDYTKKVANAVNSVPSQSFKNALEALLHVRDNEGIIYIAGNGGSAAIANHLAVDLLKTKFKSDSYFRAISLSSNTSVITAISNDDSNDQIFSKQLEIMASPNDLLFTISSSGRSPNIALAVKAAINLKIPTISLEGFDGTENDSSSIIKLHTLTQHGDYGPTEDAHSQICHFLVHELRKLASTD